MPGFVGFLAWEIAASAGMKIGQATTEVASLRRLSVSRKPRLESMGCAGVKPVGKGETLGI